MLAAAEQWLSITDGTRYIGDYLEFELTIENLQFHDLLQTGFYFGDQVVYQRFFEKGLKIA
ncbi:MAG: hypothetical protein CME32_01435 [Gimesia sp.]|nr:hypothetical protein [Gimesia sp.]